MDDVSRELDELHNGYTYTINRIRGMVARACEDVTRRLQEAHDTATSDDPWIAAIVERLEDAMAALDKLAKHVKE